MAKRRNLSLTQGKTFLHVVRWEAPTLSYKSITAITKGAPAAITSAGHGIPSGWRVAVASVQGMYEINAQNAPPKSTDFHRIFVPDANTIQLPDVNSSEFSTYTSGGVLVYMAPIDLAGYTARMTIKDRVGGTALISLTSVSGITLDNIAKTITIKIDDAALAAVTKRYGVYDLELESAGGDTTGLLYGDVTINQEVTT